MANKFQVKRTAVSGRTPNTTSSGNTHYIDTGELALNLTDGKLFSSNGSASFEVGANLASLKVTGEANVSTLKVTGLANVSTLNVVGDANVAGKLSVTASSGDEGGEIFLAPAANTSLAGGITVDSYQNKLRFFEQGGTARGVYIDLTQCSGGAGTNLLGGTGTVTQVNTGNGLTGGPITSSGTVSVLANSGIIANATGLYVNSTYIATLAANSATYLGGNTAADLRSYSDTQAATAYSNAASYADSRAATAYTNAASYADTVAGTAYTNAIAYSSNATNISSGTLNAARLPASAVQNTDSRTLSGNLVISGTYFNPSANTILLGNSTQRWVVSANTINASGLITATAGANLSSNLTISSGGIVANGSVGTAGQTLASNGSGVYWANTISSILTASATAPSSPADGNFWYKTTTDVLYQYFDDGTSNYWVDVITPVIGGTASAAAANTGYTFSGTTTGNTETEIFIGGVSNSRLGVAANTTVTYDVMISARRTDATGFSAGFNLKGVVDNFSGTVADVGTLYENVIARDDVNYLVDVRADDTNNSLGVYVTGVAGHTIKWVATVTTVEVSQ